MRSQQHYKLKISTLCPVHIGCDEAYEPTNYVIDDATLFEFDTQGAIKALGTAQRQQLNKLVNSKPDETMIKGVQSFFYKNRDDLIAYANHFLPVASGVAELYQKRIGKAAQIESRGKQVINKLEIERTFYNPVSRLPILPGSSIKGAIRTALLDNLNQGKPLKTNQRKQKERNQELQKRLFNYKDMHQDPMRLVQIGDAHYVNANNNASKEVRFAVNRAKKLKQKDGRLLQSQAEEKGLFQLLECVTGMNSSAFDLQITLQTPDFKSGKKLPDENLRWTLDDIFNACNRFYLPKLEKELKLLRDMGYADIQWLDQLETLLSEQYQTRFENQQAMLLRLGRHSGAEAVTLDGIRSIKIMKGNKGKDSYEAEARTIWLSASDEKSKQQMTPFGWVIIERDSLDWYIQATKPEQTQQWTEQVRQKQQILLAKQQQKQAQQQAREQQAAAEEKRLAEAKAQQQAKLEAAKNNMSALAGEFFEEAQNKNWQNDKNAFWQMGIIENWLEKLEASAETALDKELYQQIETLMEIHFKGAIQNPEKTTGKKHKPAYKPRVQEIAKRLQALQPE